MNWPGGDCDADASDLDRRADGVVLVASLGLTGLALGLAIWAGATFLVTCGVLSLAVVGAVCRGGAGRAWWLGFALFGWGYLGLVFWGRASARTGTCRRSPCSGLLPEPLPRRAAWARLRRAIARSTPITRRATASSASCRRARRAAGPRPLRHRRPDRSGRSPGRAGGLPPRRWWRRPAVVGSGGFVAASGVALVGLDGRRGCGRRGLLRDVGPARPGGRRRRLRAAGPPRGLARGRPLRHRLHGPDLPPPAPAQLAARRDRPSPVCREGAVPLDHPGGPPRPRAWRCRTPGSSRRSDLPIPMHFPQETPLEDVLKAIRARRAARTAAASRSTSTRSASRRPRRPCSRRSRSTSRASRSGRPCARLEAVGDDLRGRGRLVGHHQRRGDALFPLLRLPRGPRRPLPRRRPLPPGPARGRPRGDCWPRWSAAGADGQGAEVGGGGEGGGGGRGGGSSRGVPRAVGDAGRVPSSHAIPSGPRPVFRRAVTARVLRSTTAMVFSPVIATKVRGRRAGPGCRWRPGPA